MEPAPGMLPPPKPEPEPVIIKPSASDLPSPPPRKPESDNTPRVNILPLLYPGKPLLPLGAEVAEVAMLEYFKQKEYYFSAELYHYFLYGDGSDYQLSPAKVESLLSEQGGSSERRNGENDKNPANQRAQHDQAFRDSAQPAAAAQQAAETNQPVHGTFSTPWATVSSDIRDTQYSLGGYSVCGTTAFVVHPPGPDGTQHVEAVTQMHMYDYYDFDWTDFQDKGVNPVTAGTAASDAMSMTGVGNEFYVYGSTEPSFTSFPYTPGGR